MKLQLQEVDVADGIGITLVYISSFYSTESYRAEHPSKSFEDLLAAARSRWRKNYSSPTEYYLKAVDLDNGKIVGFCKVGFANTDARQRLPKQSGILLDYDETKAMTQNKDIALAPTTAPATTKNNNQDQGILSRRCDAFMEEVIQDRPSMQIWLMGTLPEYHRRGVGSLLMARINDFADQERLVCHVVATSEGMNLYSKFGYEIQEQIQVPSSSGGTYVTTIALREFQT